MNQRFYSLDVFRGATVALMILVNNPGNWSHIYLPLEHAAWHGCTPTDLVFPFFLFAVGNAMSFVMPRLEAGGTIAFLKKIMIRSLLIFGIGLLLNWSPFVNWQGNQLTFKSFGNVRIFGVLQRIALCYFFASLIIYFFKSRGAFIASVAILIGYWIVCLFVGNPIEPYSLEGFWGTPVDRSLLGDNHIYKGEGVAFDPEGLISTIPAITQVVFGYLIGQYIQQKGKIFEMVSNLFVAGAVFIFAGLCWDMIFPMNKKIWSSSFVIYSTGVAITILAVMIHILEFRKYKGFPTRFFDVFGRNPLFIFVLSGLLPRLLALIRIPDHIDNNRKTIYLTPFGWFYEYICKPVSNNLNNGSLFYAVCMISFYWLIGYWLDKKKIFIKV
ncbi:MAG: heparan-alpha-glucosaminide N-acetyltransferase domain-containing protein [Chitinophagaceae bacterium]